MKCVGDTVRLDEILLVKAKRATMQGAQICNIRTPERCQCNQNPEILVCSACPAWPSGLNIFDKIMFVPDTYFIFWARADRRIHFELQLTL